jgi:3-oxoacyl-(acyl-carrier-protein) synthase/3-hydroxymyristoyl/3-hydroxydecanoyl-(acyl carrier protein) dehydratase/1-acyl-sn-glycerol-3-phosphate acyltransferase
MQPIAIVGRSAVLPAADGALWSSEDLWQAVRSGADLLSDVPADRWRIRPENAVGDGPDRTWCTRGGYVRGFEQRFDAALHSDPYRLPSEKLLGLDPLFKLVLHTGRQAMRDAGMDDPVQNARVGAIFGNLSYPSASLARFAESVWWDTERVDPLNRFMSGMPAHLLAMALGLGGPAFALDAACASSLYAMKLACDALIDGRADVMLAGAVNRCDDLFIHTGFCALNAMSRSGRSRPFHAEADGLVPAEGAGMLVLKRLSDAHAANDTIHGVIRAVGLSNDGRGKGFLAPAVEGQERAMRSAWEQAGLDPATVGLLECHATGTTVGDATELASMARVFGDRPGTPIGSLKSNFGHLVTAAGVAGVLKVLEAMRHGERPPTLHADHEHPDIAGSPFRLLHRAEAWHSDGPRRAGINAFGFGGNNAHLILEEPGAVPAPSRLSPVSTDPIAVVAVGARVGDGTSAAALREDLVQGRRRGPAKQVEVALQGLRFPPKNLEQSRAQQTLLLEAAREAVATGPALDRDRTMVLVGMGADPEVCRYGARWRLADHLSGEALDEARDAVIAVLRAPGVVGNMPNIPANRLNSQFDVAGPSFTVSAEELSGGVALDLAVRALRAGEVDAALVGAVDLSAEPVHAEALAGVGASKPTGDAAITFVLKRLTDAEASNDPVLAVLSEDTSPAVRFGAEGFDAAASFGHAHAANGLVNLAAAVFSGQRAEVVTRSFAGFTHHIKVAPGTHPLPDRPASTGPTLSFPAHPPPMPRLVAPSIESPVMQKMDPAPSLPPTTVDGPARPLEPSAVPPAARPAGPPASAPPPDAAMAFDTAQAPVTSAPASALIAIQQHLGQIHRDYLAQQQALHEQFLQTRRTALQTLQQAQIRGRNGVRPHTPTARQHVYDAPPAPRPAATPVVTRAPAPVPVKRPTPARAPVPENGVGSAPLAPPLKSTVKSAGEPQAKAEDGLTSRPDDGSFALPGPRFDRADLEHLASHAISERFGPMFAVQDDFPRQVRMPEPPLLLCDRVTGIDAEPGSMTTGTIWTETDVDPDDWYVHHGHMPAGIMIESGQADLLLISWLGADFQNRGERVYRLLGCELTYRGGLPAVGDTLKYDIHVDGHAQQGDVRLFFFHYDCRVDGAIRLSVRQGQAGFFTDQELAESNGILWRAETGEHDPNARLDPPAIACTRTSFDEAQIRAFANGDVFECFGPGFEVTQAHTRTPRIQHGDMTFLHAVTHLETRGGPWKRGYLRAEQQIRPDDWFFDGHFKDDPCMPGTLMFEGCLQALAFWMTAQGYTVDKDGWRFEPVPDVPYQLKCRGQCTPQSRELIYEVFVEEVHDGPIPTVYADFLCTVDGLGAFHARRVGLQLVPGWPLDEGHAILDAYDQTEGAKKPVATMEDGFPFDYRSLLACAWGKPSEAFGAPYSVFDHVKKVARLPGPPYHFLTRVTSVSEPFGGFKPGVKISVEYDIPRDAWYFWENAHPTMPFAVLLEAALQPCGWLASYVGSALTTDEELFFRNLDGTGTLLTELLPTSGTLRTDVEITAVSASGGMIIEGFDVTCFLGDTPVYEMKTVFGFFPAVALANQLGIPPTDAERAAVRERTAVVDLRSRPAKYFDGPLALPEPMLLMCDRITAYWPDGGKEGLGRVLGEKDVNPAEWFFASHFFQDPVQPGSLGIENLIQVLMWAAIEKGLAEGMDNPHFEPLMLGRPLTWKYRGQVVPKNNVIRTEIDIVEIGEDDRGRFIVCDGWLWADELRIYQAVQMGVRVVDGPRPEDIAERPVETDRDLGRSYRPDFGSGSSAETVLDPEGWLADHRPTFTAPALPAMSMTDALVGAAGGAPAALSDVQVHRWLPVDAPVRVQTDRDGETVRLSAWRDAARAELSRFEPVCTGTIAELGERPDPWEPLDAPVVDDPYTEGTLFHGPAFQYLTSLKRNANGASGILDPARGTVPAGVTHQGLLDAMTHVIPHDALPVWWPEAADDQVAYPYTLSTFRVFGSAPTGPVRVEVRPEAMEGRFVTSRFQIIDGDAVWADGTLREICMPKGPLGVAAPADRRAFLRDGSFVDGLALSRLGENAATCHLDDVRASDWLPGTVDAIYGLAGLQGDARLEAIAVKDVCARALRIHPSAVDAERRAPRDRPLHRASVVTSPAENAVEARLERAPALDISEVRDWWTNWFDMPPWPVEDLYYGLIERFIGDVHLADPDGFESIRGRSVLYLANHQVAVESLLFSVLASGLTGVPTVTLAKIEHQHTWLGRLIAHAFSYPGCTDPEVITFFDREDKASLPRIIGELAAEMMGPGKSVMVHIEGTRSLSCRTPVQKMSSAFVDMAVKTGSPIVPVRFVGALPTEPLSERLEFPVGLGRQQVWFGSPIEPSVFEAVPYKARKQLVIDGINALGPSNLEEVPTEPDPAFQARVAAWKGAHPQTDDDHAVLAAVLQEVANPTEETRQVLTGEASTDWAKELQRRLFEGL